MKKVGCLNSMVVLGDFCKITLTKYFLQCKTVNVIALGDISTL